MSFPVAGSVNKLSVGHFRSRPRQGLGYTIMELLSVIAIMTILAVLALPAFTSMATAGSMTSASYAISGAMQSARSYAMAHDTYTWLGFYEENGSGGFSQSRTKRCRSSHPVVGGLHRRDDDLQLVGHPSPLY